MYKTDATVVQAHSPYSNKSVKKKTSTKRQNSNLHSCENITSEYPSRRENTWKTAHANFSICACKPRFLAPLILPLPQFLAFRWKKRKVLKALENVTFPRLESCLRSFASGSLTSVATKQLTSEMEKNAVCGRRRNSSLSG